MTFSKFLKIGIVRIRVKSVAALNVNKKIARGIISLFALISFAAIAGNVANSEVTQPLRFKDCDVCSEMISIQSGSYLMGATTDEFVGAAGYQSMYSYESPRHQVNVKSFAIAIFSVTRHQFSVFAKETGFSEKGCRIFNGFKWEFNSDADWQNPGFRQTDQDPVVCISWGGAQKFIEWINSKIPNTKDVHYRLPTEEEWEYAARAGTTTPMYWGRDRTQQCTYENARDLSEEKMGPDGPHVNCDDGYARTSPVGSFKPNPWGLFDMLGNAYQWISDCSHIGYHDYLRAPPAAGAPDCRMRVVRGASWVTVPFGVRSASRLAFKTNERESTIGFRLAADLSNKHQR
ncbi:Sulfatase-modifying factor enzyme domain-containing protein [Paraburkholderia kururiensis]|uniref:formylglycine-generating enzyme family protein n=1 Tax=Paraburkholderia kururiensis TaxID=984307 RepID=UPI0039A4BDF5